MKKLLLAAFALSLSTLALPAVTLDYEVVPGWLKLPPGQSLGDQHGDIAVSSNGEIYVSTMDPDAGLRVFAANGAFLRIVPGAPNDFHGFIIHREKEGEFIYGARLKEQSVLKMTLDGRVVLEIPGTAIPDRFKLVTPPNTKKNAAGEIVKNPSEGKPFLRLTGVAVAPNGDIYVTDGYASDYIHRFDRNGAYLASFGGKGAPYHFSTLHKIAIDTRFVPARILCCDRKNLRLVHLSLDGEFLGVFANDLLLPSAIAIRGDYAAIAELNGRVTLLDKSGQVVARIGTNPIRSEVGTNKTAPALWRPGIFNAPHGLAFNARGDLFVSEWSNFGRVHRFNLRSPNEGSP